MKNIVGFFGSDRYQTIAVWRYLNRKFRNGWTFRRPQVWQDLSAQNCWQMPQVFVYTDKLSDEQWPPTQDAFLKNVRLGDFTVRYMDALHDTWRSWSKLGRLELDCEWWKQAAVSMDNITKSITCMQKISLLLLDRALYMKKIQPFVYRSKLLPRTIWES